MMIPLNDPRRGRVMLRKHLIEEGYTDRSIARHVRADDWVRIRHGAYVDSGTWRSLDAAGQHALIVRAAVAQARTAVIVSHVSALPFLDVPTWGIELDAAHLTRADGKAGRSEAGLKQHCGALIDGDVVSMDGLDVMAPTRVALEVTTVADVEASMCVVSLMMHSGLTSMLKLKARYESMRHWPDTLRTDLVLRLSDERFESIGECRTYHLCFREGLPMPEPQYEIRDEHGNFIARVDFAWPELGVFLEFDGKVKYEKLLRDGERASAVVLRERDREREICRVTGWRCIRIVWSDLARPAQTAAMIRRELRPTAA